MVSDESRSSSARKERLSLLLRQREGEAERLRLQSSLESISTAEWRLLSLSDTDVVGPELFAAVRAAREDDRLLTKTELAVSEFENDFRRVLADWPESHTILVALSNFSQIGLLEIGVDSLILIAHRLIDFDRDSMVAVSKDMSRGVIAQRFEYDRDVSYQLEYWKP